MRTEVIAWENNVFRVRGWSFCVGRWDVHGMVFGTVREGLMNRVFDGYYNLKLNSETLYRTVPISEIRNDSENEIRYHPFHVKYIKRSTIYSTVASHRDLTITRKSPTIPRLSNQKFVIHTR